MEWLYYLLLLLKWFNFCNLIGAFASLSVSSLDVNYKSSALAESGINTMCLVSISSMVKIISINYINNIVLIILLLLI